MNTSTPIEPVLLPGEERFELTQADGDTVRGCIRDTGTGPIGIYVHGFRSHCNGDKALTFADDAARKHRSWLRFDMRGHGLSSGELVRQNISSGLQDLESVIAYTGNRPLILIGSSMGGWISVLAALRQPQRIVGMVLMAPAFNYVQKSLATLPEPVLAQWQREGRMTFPDAYDREPYTVEYQLIDDASQYDVLGTPIELDMPLHIIHGDADAIVPLSTTREFVDNAHARRLTLEVVPGGDHRLLDHIPLIITHIDQVWRETETT